jgi:hypothetical protein
MNCEDVYLDAYAAVSAVLAGRKRYFTLSINDDRTRPSMTGHPNRRTTPHERTRRP